MRNETRQHYNAYVRRQAELNGIEDGTQQFSVEPTVEQSLEERIRESSGFLQRINIHGVREQEGEKLGLDVGSTIASTTDTDLKERETADPTTLDKDRYRCQQTNFDTHVKYAKLDAWAKFPDFQTRLRNVVTQQIARDRLMIGFNGMSRSATSDRAANPLLQDVNVGWLEHLRQNSQESVISDIKVGNGGDYQNIDAAVYDATNELIAEWYRDDPELVVIMGRELLADKYLALINEHDAPTERNALDIIISNKQIGGLKTVRVPYFPSRSFAITRLNNLSIYYQEGSRRRHIMDNPRRDRIEDYQSVNEAYVVEDYNLVCLVENILVPDGSGGWA
ncbi:phage major capsid protein, P2 family [Veronia nyctiphanis]|uniref:Phage major capsid protein, P2 family n=1 Tax=Veronia nyctiphanis TaxID=1278244 RepID=A0A4Q0YMU8_9GAMM|nr:phage major capsid protein, P2 family [Veronia nyctiphanis]RXJ70639.1 phage major capsid protein, P2 family [Veronia nyctiphanis]